jgi:hypothetical protein
LDITRPSPPRAWSPPTPSSPSSSPSSLRRLVQQHRCAAVLFCMVDQ